MEPVVIAVIITGSVPRKKDSPALPTTPAEQVENTHEAFEAGAALVHIHISGPTKRARAEAAMGRFKQVIGDGLRSRTDPRLASELDADRQCAEPYDGPTSVRIA